MLEISAQFSKSSSHPIASRANFFHFSTRERTNYGISRGKKNSKRGIDSIQSKIYIPTKITIQSDLSRTPEEELEAQTDHKTEHRAKRRKTRKSEKEKQDGAGKETPENFLRRLTDFASRRFLLAVSCES